MMETVPTCLSIAEVTVQWESPMRIDPEMCFVCVVGPCALQRGLTLHHLAAYPEYWSAIFSIMLLQNCLQRQHTPTH